jgi:hypothetical protein
MRLSPWALLCARSRAPEDSWDAALSGARVGFKGAGAAERALQVGHLRVRRIDSRADGWAASHSCGMLQRRCSLRS